MNPALRVLLSGAVCGFAELAQAGSVALTLPFDATTSAGVYDANDRLVRTLWGGRFHTKGQVTLDWDGLDDGGKAVARAGRYRVRLLAHNVRYLWEGIIGNTSRETTGPHIYRGLNTINSMAIDAKGHAFYALGYDEQQSSLHEFNISDPQSPTALGHDDYRRVFRYVATDGTLAYFANTGLMAAIGAFNREPTTFVIALNVVDGTQYHFPEGRVDMSGGYWGNRWDSVIDYDHEDVADEDGSAFRRSASGLAVQQRGSALFAAHRRLDEVRVLDKRTGGLLTRIAVSDPTGLAVAPDDSLWVLCHIAGEPSAVHYRWSGGSWAMVDAPIKGLEQPLAIGISPLDGTIVIADGASEQLRAFDSHGNPAWQFGSPKGYQIAGPEVRVDRLWLSSDASDPAYIAFQPDGSFWVGDPGNARNLHFSADRHYLGQIMYLPVSYHVVVDPAAPGRVFNRYLEFSVDYSLPLASSWKLERNWAAGTGRRYLGNMDGFRAVFTLPNGRTYGVVPRYDIKRTEIVELTVDGLHPTGVLLEVGEKLYADGSLRRVVAAGSRSEVRIRRLSGFTSAGTPRWSDEEQLVGLPQVRPEDPYYHDVPLVGGVNEATFPVTDSGVVVFFNPGLSNGFHLGGVQSGGTDWLWRASPAGTWSLGSEGQVVNADGTYEVRRGVQYAGNVALTLGRSIIYGYHGEAWNGGQANQFLHFLDDGLFVGQFGRPVYPADNKTFAHAGAAGNAFSAQLVSVGGRSYLWHNDESVHAGVHRWRIDGLDDIKILEAAIEP